MFQPGTGRPRRTTGIRRCNSAARAARNDPYAEAADKGIEINRDEQGVCPGLQLAPAELTSGHGTHGVGGPHRYQAGCLQPTSRDCQQ